MMPTISVRALDPVTWEPQNGNDEANFLVDVAAVAQIIATRLKMFQGEWFLNLQDGLPLFQSILGSQGTPRNIQFITNVIASRILGSPYVTAVNKIQVLYTGRRYDFYAVVSTQFGQVFLSNVPGSDATLVTST
jgi:hypothetical protein